MTILASPTVSRDAALALSAIDQAGLQAPSAIRLNIIVQYARAVTALLRAGALRRPSPGEIDEMFLEFVVRCINRPPGIGDVLTEEVSAVNSLGSVQ